MSFYSDASLVMIPSGYKTSKVYSAVPTDGSGDLTFSRTADTATRVGPDGLIEKVRTNRLLQSNTFNNATWTINGTGTVTTGATDPFGGTTAWTLAKTSLAAFLYQSTAGFSGSVTFSIYAKAGTVDQLWLNHDQSGSFSSYFDLTLGTAISPAGCVATIVSVGGGWYRCSIAGTVATPNNIRIYPASGGSVSGTTGNILIYGIQGETSDIATSYIATTSAAVSVGPVANVPRLDYLNSSCPRLLLEPQRTNSMVNSESFASWIGIDNVTVGSNTTDTLDPAGYNGADKITIGSGAPLRIYELTGSTAGTGTISLFAKAGTSNTISLFTSSASLLVTFNLSTQVVTPNTGTGTITNYGNGWYRITATATLGSNEVLQILFTGSNGQTIYVWGAQVEAGAYATSYIPTLGAAVTRGTDTYQKGGFGNTSTSGTFFCEFVATRITSDNGMYLYGMGVGTTDTLGSSYANAAGSLSIIGNGPSLEGRNNGYATTLFSFTPTTGATVKIAIRYDGTNVVAFVNGVKQTVYTDNAVGVKNFIRVNNGEQSSHATKQILFFPTALSDADATALTA